jgi:hypothetical protein
LLILDAMAKPRSFVAGASLALFGLMAYNELRYPLAVHYYTSSSTATATAPTPPASSSLVLGTVRNDDGAFPPPTAKVRALEAQVRELSSRLNQLLLMQQQQQPPPAPPSGSTAGDTADGPLGGTGMPPLSSSSAFSSSASSFSSSEAPAAALPRCDELMRRPNSPFGDGNFLTSHTTPVRWVPRPDGSRELQLGALCRLKRYTPREAGRCLRNRHVSMIGDSLTRYLYLSLAYMLEHGTFPPRFRRPKDPNEGCRHLNETGHPACSTSDRPNICVEGEWGNWRNYLTHLGGGEDGDVMNGRMECKSFRPTGSEKGTPNGNLLYVHGESRAVLSFASEYGWKDSPTPLHGFHFTNCSYEGTCRRTERDNLLLANRSLHDDFDWSEPFPEAVGRNGILRAVFPRPDIAIVRDCHTVTSMLFCFWRLLSLWGASLTVRMLLVRAVCLPSLRLESDNTTHTCKQYNRYVSPDSNSWKALFFFFFFSWQVRISHL